MFKNPHKCAQIVIILRNNNYKLNIKKGSNNEILKEVRFKNFKSYCKKRKN